MRAAVVEKPYQLRVREVPDLVPGPFQALVQILACSICNGTDLKLLHGQFPGIGADGYPGIIGHEAVGRVVRLGPEVKYLKEGDLIFRAGAVYPPDAPDRINVFWGGFAEYGLATDARALREAGRTFPGNVAMQQIVPGWLDPVDATICITFKETLSWLQKFGVARDTSLLVMGTGPVGLSFARFAKLLGAHPVIVLGRREERLELATKLGADGTINTASEDPIRKCRKLTGGLGVGKVVEAVGDDALIEIGLQCLRSGGALGIYGLAPSPGGKRAEKRLIFSGLPGEWSLAQIQPDEPATHTQVMDAIRLGFLAPKDFYSHVLSFGEISEGFRLLEERKALKVVVRIAE